MSGLQGRMARWKPFLTKTNTKNSSTGEEPRMFVKEKVRKCAIDSYPKRLTGVIQLQGSSSKY